MLPMGPWPLSEKVLDSPPSLIPQSYFLSEGTSTWLDPQALMVIVINGIPSGKRLHSICIYIYIHIPYYVYIYIYVYTVSLPS